jgi:type III secretion protein T
VMIVIFYLIGGPFLFLDAISSSYDIIPPDQFLSPGFFSANSNFWINMTKLFNEVMTIAIQMCTPALIAILMTDVFLGIANRLAPQVQITFLGMPLKSLLGIAIICLGWGLLTGAFSKQAMHWLDLTKEMISYFK